jgi:hypothetical protein
MTTAQPRKDTGESTCLQLNDLDILVARGSPFVFQGDLGVDCGQAGGHSYSRGMTRNSNEYFRYVQH